MSVTIRGERARHHAVASERKRPNEGDRSEARSGCSTGRLGRSSSRLVNRVESISREAVPSVYGCSGAVVLGAQCLHQGRSEQGDEQKVCFGGHGNSSCLWGNIYRIPTLRGLVAPHSPREGRGSRARHKVLLRPQQRTVIRNIETGR